MVNLKQKELLLAISKAGKAQNITSTLGMYEVYDRFFAILYVFRHRT